MNQQPDLESDTLRSEIDSTRGRMDQTIDALEDRLQGRHLLDEIVGFFRRGDTDGRMGELREKIGSSAGKVVDSVKAHPVPLLMIGAGIGWLIYQNRSAARSASRYDERDLDYTGEDYSSSSYESFGSPVTGFEGEGFEPEGSTLAGKAKEKISALGTQASEKAADLSQRGREKLASARDRASELGHQAQQRGRELYGRTRERVVSTADQHPLEVGIGFLALGVIAGMAIPTPEAVTRRLAPTAQRLREAGSDLVNKGKRVVDAAAEAGKVEAKTQGLTLDGVRDKATAVAERAGDAAKETAKHEGIALGGVSAENPSSARPAM